MITYHNDFFAIEKQQLSTSNRFSWSVFPTKQKTFVNHISIDNMYVIFTTRKSEFADIVSAVGKRANTGVSLEVGEEIALYFQGNNIRIYSHQWGVNAKLNNSDWVEIGSFLDTILQNGSKTTMEHFSD